MVLQAFSLLDQKAGFFNVPFFFPSNGQAVRATMDLARDMSTVIGRHPEDFALYHIGSWDDQSGSWTAVTPPLFICTAASLLPLDRPGSLFADKE